MPGHVIGTPRLELSPIKELLGVVNPRKCQSGNVLVVCFEFSALMVACGGRHVELSTIFTMAGVDPRWRRMNLFGRR